MAGRGADGVMDAGLPAGYVARILRRCRRLRRAFETRSSGDGAKEAPSPAYVSDFLATSEGLSLTKAFMRIKEPKLRRRIVDLVEEIAGDADD